MMRSNHLGNVLTTFSDKKIPVDENSDGIIDFYQPHIISSSDYSPFGAQLTERSFFSETYPNSFNNKRDDPELDDWQDYGMRMYSPWQRRFPSPDPLIVYGQEYAWLSTYQFASNSPIMNIDLDGLDGQHVAGKSVYGRQSLISVFDIHSAMHELCHNLIHNHQNAKNVNPDLFSDDIKKVEEAHRQEDGIFIYEMNGNKRQNINQKNIDDILNTIPILEATP